MTRKRIKIPGFAARLFWSFHSFTWDAAFSKESIEQVINLIDDYAQPPGELLDLGCGTGNYSIALAEHGWKVTGIDFSGAMLRRARKKSTKTKAGLLFTWVDLNLPLSFSSDTFDCVVCFSVLQCLSNPYDLFLEIHRVLRPGGFLFITVKAKPGEGSIAATGSISLRLTSKLKSLVSNPGFLHSFQLSEIVSALNERGLIVMDARKMGPWLRVIAKAS